MTNKIKKPFYTTAICLLIFLSAAQFNYKQPQHGQAPVPEVISTIDAYTQSIKYRPDKALVNLQQYIPGLAIELRYAGTNNFMRQAIYPGGSTAYLRTSAARALAKVQQRLNRLGLGLKIYDAYRPHSATKKIWQLVQDERYAADPAKGSDHNRAVAVDITLVQRSSGRELDMGTDFDNFTDTARHRFRQLPVNVLNNRRLLKNLMEQAGFKALETEWWHYAYITRDLQELLNLDFQQLSSLN